MKWPNFLLLALLASSSTACLSYSDSNAVFDRTKLHTIEISVDAGDVNTLATMLDTRVPCTVTYDGEVVEGAGIRQKGNQIHALDDRPSFSLKFNEFDSTSKLFDLTKLVLDSSDQDKSFLREQIGADLYTRAGLPTSRIAHGLVRLNGSDLGLYIVGEAVTKGFLTDRFGGAGDGNLYEGPCCGDFVDDVGHMILDNQVEEGRTRDDINALADVIRSAPDSEFEAKVNDHLDLDRAITSFAIDAALGHWDDYFYGTFEGPNNYYMYDDPAAGRFTFIPHGMDRVLQVPKGVLNFEGDDWARFDPETPPAGKLAQRIRAIPALEARFKSEISRVINEVWDPDALNAGIDETERVLHAGIPAGTAGKAGDSLAKFDKHVGDMRDLVKQRRALFDASIVCGDVKIQGLETCDDGNTVSGDGCSAICRQE